MAEVFRDRKIKTKVQLKYLEVKNGNNQGITFVFRG